MAGVFLLHAFAYFLGAQWVMPQGLRNAIDFVMNPVTYFALAVAALVLLLAYRRFLTEPVVAWTLLNVGLL